MIIENIPTLKVQKLTQEQYDNALQNGTLDNNSIYLTPTEIKDYALRSDLDTKADLVDGKITVEQLPDEIATKSDLENVIAAIDAALSAAIGSGVLA